jgi:hypothetical protein
MILHGPSAALRIKIDVPPDVAGCNDEATDYRTDRTRSLDAKHVLLCIGRLASDIDIGCRLYSLSNAESRLREAATGTERATRKKQ